MLARCFAAQSGAGGFLNVEPCVCQGAHAGETDTVIT